MFKAIGHMIKHGFQLGIYNLYQHIKLMGSAVLFKFVITLITSKIYQGFELWINNTFVNVKSVAPTKFYFF